MGTCFDPWGRPGVTGQQQQEEEGLVLQEQEGQAAAAAAAEAWVPEKIESI